MAVGKENEQLENEWDRIENNWRNTYGTKTGGNLDIVVLVRPTNEKRK